MKNLSAINHNRFSQLFEITNSYNKATLLDKFIYWWQISTFTIANDPHIWFTRSREQIAEESRLSLRTVDRYLNEFSQKGFIEKTNKLLLKKHLYIRVTNKLLTILGLANQQQTPTKKSSFSTFQSTGKKIMQTKKCNILSQDGSIDFANLAVSIYKEKYNKINNSTVKTHCHVIQTKNKNTDKVIHSHSETLIQQNTDKPFSSSRLSQYIRGIIKNLTVQHGLKISAPEQLYAEIEYSVLNKTHQFIGIEDNIHRLNLIAKLLRNNLWKTPKGFFKYSAAGKLVQQNIIKNEKKWQETKELGGAHSRAPSNHNKYNNDETQHIQKELKEINRLLQTETNYYHDMKLRQNKKPSSIVQKVIDTTLIKLNHLCLKQKQLLEKLRETKVA